MRTIEIEDTNRGVTGYVVFDRIETIGQYAVEFHQLLWGLLALINDLYYGLLCSIYEALGEGISPLFPLISRVIT